MILNKVFENLKKKSESLSKFFLKIHFFNFQKIHYSTFFEIQFKFRFSESRFKKLTKSLFKPIHFPGIFQFSKSLSFKKLKILKKVFENFKKSECVLKVFESNFFNFQKFPF